MFASNHVNATDCRFLRITNRTHEIVDRPPRADGHVAARSLRDRRPSIRADTYLRFADRRPT